MHGGATPAEEVLCLTKEDMDHGGQCGEKCKEFVTTELQWERHSIFVI